MYFIYCRINSGGSFGVVSATLDYRENFKKSLRTYERSGSRHGPPRPVFSAIYGRNAEVDPKYINAQKTNRISVNSKLLNRKQQGKSVEHVIPMK